MNSRTRNVMRHLVAGCAAVFWMPSGGVMASLQARCIMAGVTFEWNAEVTGFGQHANRISMVQTTRGEFGGDEFVLCGGAWSPTLARGLGLRIPMQAGFRSLNVAVSAGIAIAEGLRQTGGWPE